MTALLAYCLLSILDKQLIGATYTNHDKNKAYSILYNFFAGSCTLIYIYSISYSYGNS